MRNSLKSIIIAIVIFVFLLIVFFVYYVPQGSLEGRAAKAAEIFSRKEIADVKLEFVEYISRFTYDEQIEIFDALPFSVIEENSDLLIEIFDERNPDWRKSESFNASYLMTEVDLRNKENAKVLKHLEPVSLKATYTDLKGINDDIESLLAKVWQVEQGAAYIVGDNFNCHIKLNGNASEVLTFNIDLFDIKTAYIFKVTYSNGVLTINPEDRQFDDDGALQLLEKFAIYDYSRIWKHISTTDKIGWKVGEVYLSDKYIDANSHTDQVGSQFRDILTYVDKIVPVDAETKSKLTYEGSIRYVMAKAVNNSDGGGKTEEGGVSGATTFSVNIFKDR